MKNETQCLASWVFYVYTDVTGTPKRGVCFLNTFFLFSFYGCTCGIWKFPGWGRIGAAAASLCHSYGNTRSETDL